MRIYFFGCYTVGGGGHLLWSPYGSRREAEDSMPFVYRILDAALLGPDLQTDQVQGKGVRVLINGWTVVSFWDRTGDSRHGPNSAFVAEGDVSTEEVLRHAQATYPKVLERLRKAGVTLDIHGPPPAREERRRTREACAALVRREALDTRAAAGESDSHGRTEFLRSCAAVLEAVAGEVEKVGVDG